MDNSNIHFATELAELLKPFEQVNGRKITLIIHAGTPKTGTTSLQAYLDKKQRKLRGKGILYPHNLDKATNSTAPRNQWFEKNLVTTHRQHLLENFKNIISQLKDDTHTIILSSEGVYNYWWDFPDQSKSLLIELSALFDTQIWVWFREPLGFIESYYKQCIRNPKIKNNPCYGRDFSFAEMLDIEWFARHLDYRGFVIECQEIFGQNSVSVFEYQGDVVQEAIQKLGLATPHDNPTPRQNKSLSRASIEVLRTINRFDLKAKDKSLVIPHLKKIDDVLSRYDDESLIDDESRKRVLGLYSAVKF